MAEEKRATPRLKIIGVIIGLLILLVVAASLYIAQSFEDIKSIMIKSLNYC